MTLALIVLGLLAFAVIAGAYGSRDLASFFGFLALAAILLTLVTDRTAA